MSMQLKVFVLAALLAVVLSFSMERTSRTTRPPSRRLSVFRYAHPSVVDDDADYLDYERGKREMDGLGDALDPFPKRTSLKRLVIISARGFGRR